MEPKDLIEASLLRMAAAAEKKGITGDGWQNVVTGVGDVTRDKRFGAIPTARLLDYESLLELYRAEHMAERIVDLPAKEMTREWAEVKIVGDEKTAEDIEEEHKRLKSRDRFYDAIRWQRLFGGACILMGVADGTIDLSKPVNEKNIRSIDFLTVFDSTDAQVVEWEANPGDPNFGEPLFYRIFPKVFGFTPAPILMKVHRSRVLRFCGKVANRTISVTRQGWGDSVLDNTWSVIRDFSASYDGAASLVQDFAQGVFKIKGLAAAMASDRESLVVKRLQMLDYSRSLLRALAVDADGEDFKRESTPISGLDGLLDKFAQNLSAAAQMPVTLLMGQAPAGLNATGDADTRNWYDFLSAEQERNLKPQLDLLTRYIMLAKDGPCKGVEPKVWEVEFKPLWQLDDTQKATRNYTQAQADQIYITTGVLNADEVRENRFAGDQYSSDTSVEMNDMSAEPVDGATLPRIGPDGQPIEVSANGNAPANPTKGNEGPAVAPTGGPNDPKTPAVGTVPTGASQATTPMQGKPSAPPAPKPPMPASGPLGQHAAGLAPKAAGPAAPPKQADQAMAGGQITAALQVVQAVADGKIPRETGVAMLVAFFNLQPDQAEAMMHTVGDTFKPTKPEPSPDTVAKLAATTGKPIQKDAKNDIFEIESGTRLK